MPREVASLTLLAFCALRTAAPRHWKTMLIRCGLREDWQEQYIGSRESAGEKRKLLRHAPRMFRCAEGPHWVAYEDDVQGLLKWMHCTARGTQCNRFSSPEHQFCKRHRLEVKHIASFSVHGMLDFAASEHEYVGWECLNGASYIITHFWAFDEPRYGLSNAIAFETVRHNRLLVTLDARTNTFLAFQRWLEE